MPAKERSIFYTTSYLRAFVLIFTALIALAILLKQLVEGEEWCDIVTGCIVISLDGGDIGTNNLENMAAVLIHDFGAGVYYIGLDTERAYLTTITEYFPALKEKVRMGRHAKIWYECDGASKYQRSLPQGMHIRKMVVDGETIIPYHEGTALKVIFIVCMLSIAVLSFILIPKNHAHLSGRRDENVL